MAFPLNFPTIPISAVTTRLQYNNMLSENPFTGQQQIIRRSPGYWIFTITTPPMEHADAIDIEVFLHELQGIYGTFYFSFPVNAFRGSSNGTPKVGTLDSSRVKISSTGWAANAKGVILKGDWISFTNGEYKRVLKKVDADASGNANIEFAPEMRSPVTAASSIATKSATGKFRLLNDVTDIITGDYLMNTGLTLSFREAF